MERKSNFETMETTTDIIQDYENLFDEYREFYRSKLFFALNMGIRLKSVRHILKTGQLIKQKKYNLN